MSSTSKVIRGVPIPEMSQGTWSDPLLLSLLLLQPSLILICMYLHFPGTRSFPLIILRSSVLIGLLVYIIQILSCNLCSNFKAKGESLFLFCCFLIFKSFYGKRTVIFTWVYWNDELMSSSNRKKWWGLPGTTLIPLKILFFPHTTCNL